MFGSKSLLSMWNKFTKLVSSWVSMKVCSPRSAFWLYLIFDELIVKVPLRTSQFLQVKPLAIDLLHILAQRIIEVIQKIGLIFSTFKFVKPLTEGFEYLFPDDIFIYQVSLILKQRRYFLKFLLLFGFFLLSFLRGFLGLKPVLKHSLRL